MADHNKPTLTSTYTNFLAELDARLDDLALGLDPANTTVTNIVTNSIRWSSASNKWQKWNGTTWSNLTTGYSIPLVAGTVEDTPIGATTPSSGKFTNVETTNAGSASTPSLRVGASNNGFYISGSTLRVSYAGTAVAAFGTGSNVVGSTVPSVNVFLYVNGSSVASSANAYGIFTSIGFTTDGTKAINVYQNQASCDLLDDGTARTFSKVYGYSSVTPVVSGLTAGTTVTAFAHARGGDVPSTVFTAAYGDYQEMDALAGYQRWSYYSSGTAPAYIRGDTTLAGNIIKKQPAPAAVNTTATLTTSAVLGYIVTSNPASGITLTLPTGTLLDAAIPSIAADQSVEWCIINTNASNTVTVAAGTGHTVIGNMVVALSTSAQFRSRKTAANTFVTYRVG